MKGCIASVCHCVSHCVSIGAADRSTMRMVDSPSVLLSLADQLTVLAHRVVPSLLKPMIYARHKYDLVDEWVENHGGCRAKDRLVGQQE